MAEDLIPREVVAKIIGASKGKTGKELANWIVDSLNRRDLMIAEVLDVLDPPDRHLRTLKTIRERIEERVNNDETPIQSSALSSLVRRLQDVSREIVSIEDQARAEAEKKGRRNGGDRKRTGGASGTAEPEHLDI